VGALTCTKLGCHRVYDLHINPQHPMEKLDTHSSGQALARRQSIQSYQIDVRWEDNLYKIPVVGIHDFDLNDRPGLQDTNAAVHPTVWQMLRQYPLRSLPSTVLVSSTIWHTIRFGQYLQFPLYRLINRGSINNSTKTLIVHVHALKMRMSHILQDRDDIGDRSRKWPAADITMHIHADLHWYQITTTVWSSNFRELTKKTNHPVYRK
jgi:hypothetical protein